MTVAQLKQSMDRRFDAVNEKLDAILASLQLTVEHHDQVVHEHDRRIDDLEAWRRTTQGIDR
jgi:hypothetical protein